MAIQTSNFAAEFGQAAGGYFNFTMKSGTNQFHGSAYDYFVNEALNAGLPFTDRCAPDGPLHQHDTRQHIRNRVRRNDYGFTFGGPVRIPKVYNGTDKTFFFANFEQYRNSRLYYQRTVYGSNHGLPQWGFQCRAVQFLHRRRSGCTGGTCTPFNASLKPVPGYGSGGQHASAGADLRSLQHQAGQWHSGSHALCEQ